MEHGKYQLSKPGLISLEHRMSVECCCCLSILAIVLKVETYTSVASFCAVYGSHKSIHQLEPLKAAVASSAPSGEKSQEDSRYRVFRIPPVRLRIKVYERMLQRQTIWKTGDRESLISWLTMASWIVQFTLINSTEPFQQSCIQQEKKTAKGFVDPRSWMTNMHVVHHFPHTVQHKKSRI